MTNDIASELFSIWKAFEGGGNSIMARLRIGTNINEVWLYEKGYKRLFFYNGIFL